MANQGNPFNGNSQVGESNQQGNPFNAGKNASGEPFNPGTTEQGNPFNEGTNTVGSEFNEGTGEQGNPFNVGQQSTTGDIGFQIYVEDVSITDDIVTLKRANADDLTLSLTSIITENTDTHVTAVVINGNELVVTLGGTNPSTITATLPVTEDAFRSAVLDGTDIKFYNGTTPSGDALFTLDVTELKQVFTDTNKFHSSITGAGSNTITLVGNDTSDLVLDMTGYLNSNLTRALDGLSNVDTSGVTNNQVLTYNGTTWDAQTPAAAKHVASGSVIDGPDSDSFLDTIELVLSDSSKVNISISALVSEILNRVPADNNKFINSWAFNSSSKTLSMTYNDGSTVLPNIDLSSLVDAVTSLNALSDVTISTTGEGQTLVFTGTKWINKRLSINHLEEVQDATTHQIGDVLIREASGYAARPLVLSDIADADTAAATSGNILRYNGSVWEDKSLAQVIAALNTSEKNEIANDIELNNVESGDSDYVDGIKTTADSALQSFTETNNVVAGDSTYVDGIKATADSALQNSDVSTNGTTLTIGDTSYNPAIEAGGVDWFSRVVGATSKQTKVIIDSNTKSQESTFRSSQQWKVDIKSPKSSKFYSDSAFTTEVASRY